jgi:hypothetical protein
MSGAYFRGGDVWSYGDSEPRKRQIVGKWCCSCKANEKPRRSLPEGLRFGGAGTEKKPSYFYNLPQTHRCQHSFGIFSPQIGKLRGSFPDRQFGMFAQNAQDAAPCGACASCPSGSPDLIFFKGC